MLDVLIGIRPANFIRARSHEGCFVEAGHMACTRPPVQIVIKTPCNAARLIFIDETSTNTKLTKRAGWSTRGQRYRSHAPFGAWKTPSSPVSDPTRWSRC